MILAIDQGTTGTTCLVFDDQAELIGRAYREFDAALSRVRAGSSTTLQEIWEVTQAVAGRGAGRRRGPAGRARRRSGSPTSARRSASGTARRGEPLHRAIVWQDRRTAARCDELRAAGPRGRWSASAPGWSSTRTSRPPRSSGCSATSTACASAPRAASVVFGTVDSWLIYKLTGERRDRRRPTRSRTMLFDIRRGDLGRRAARAVRGPERALPERAPELRRRSGPRADALHGHEVAARRAWPAISRRRCSARRASTRRWARTPTGPGRSCSRTPAAAPPQPRRGPARHRGLGDRRAADLRARGGDLRHRRGGPVAPRRARDHRDARPRPSRWRRSLDGNDGVYFVPALTGLGSPHWDPYARGTIVGLTRGTTRAHLARATLESIAYQTVDAVRAHGGARAACR